MRILTFLAFLAVVPAFSAQKLSEDELIDKDWICVNSSDILSDFLASKLRLTEMDNLPEDYSKGLWKFTFHEDGEFSAYAVDTNAAIRHVKITVADSLFDALDSDSLLSSEASLMLLKSQAPLKRKLLTFQKASDPAEILNILYLETGPERVSDETKGVIQPVLHLATVYTEWRLDRRRQTLLLHMPGSPDNGITYRIKYTSGNELLLYDGVVTLR